MIRASASRLTHPFAMVRTDVLRASLSHSGAQGKSFESRSTVVQLKEFDEEIERFCLFVKCLDPASFTGALAAGYAERFGRLERLCSAGKSLCAKRVADTRHFEREGASDPAHWLAALSGDSVSSARDALETASGLSGLPGLDEAFRCGELSGKQAHEVARAGALDPSREHDLLSSARSDSLRGLREKADRVAAASRSKEEDEERQRRIHAGRHLRTFTSREGAFEGRFSLTPDDGARLMGPIGALAEVIFEKAWEDGRREPREAYLADALVALAAGEGEDLLPEASGPGASSNDEAGGALLPIALSPVQPSADGAPPSVDTARPPAALSGALPPPTGSPPSRRRPRGDYTILVRIDFGALSRGRLLPGEECSIDGVGHVPVAVVQSYLDSAKVRLVVTDGVDVRSVYSCRRNVSRALDTALRARDRCCCVPGCGATFRLERDHIKEYARSGPTTLDNLCLLCSRHHKMKSTKGFRIEGSPGNWRWLRPDGSLAGAGEGAGPAAQPEGERDA